MISGSPITLRDAGPDDCERVWQWNFAPDVRAVSKHSHEVPFTEHARWFRARLEQPAPMWIIEEVTAAVGVVRVDPDGRISIAIAPKARGRGIGKHAVTMACATWGKPIVAEIDVANIASRACFEACGFVAIHERDTFVTYRWTPEEPR